MNVGSANNRHNAPLWLNYWYKLVKYIFSVHIYNVLRFCFHYLNFIRIILVFGLPFDIYLLIINSCFIYLIVVIASFTSRVFGRRSQAPDSATSRLRRREVPPIEQRLWSEGGGGAKPMGGSEGSKPPENFKDFMFILDPESVC